MINEAELLEPVGLKCGLTKYHFKNKVILWKPVITFLYDIMLDIFRLDDQVGDSITDPDKLRSHMIAMTRK